MEKMRCGRVSASPVAACGRWALSRPRSSVKQRSQAPVDGTTDSLSVAVLTAADKVLRLGVLST